MKIKASSGIATSANNINTYIDEISRSIAKIENYLNAVSRVWEGNDAINFVNKFRNEAIPELKNYVNVMREYQVFLSRVYPIFKSLDEYYDKPINT